MTLNLNLDYLNQLSDGDTDFIATILSTFAEESVKDVKEIRTAIEQNDVSAVGKLAHKNKSTLQLLGLTELKELAFDIEQRAKKDSQDLSVITNAKALAEHLESLQPIVLQQLKEL